MSLEGLLGTDEERFARQLIERTARSLGDERQGLPADFVARLFEHAVPEDLAGYDVQELGALAEQAWEFLALREPGKPKIRFVTPGTGATGDRLKGMSVIEIVNDDMPFLVDSVTGELAERGFFVRFIVHPIFSVVRDQTGRLQSFATDDAAITGAQRESFIHIHVDRVDDATARAAAVQALEHVLSDVRVCVQDWRAMLARVGTEIDALKSSSAGDVAADEVAEVAQFLEWLIADNFSFLGVREYIRDEASGKLRAAPQSGLGVLRVPAANAAGGEPAVLARSAFTGEPRRLIVAKADQRSRVHRRVLMDLVAIKRFDRDGREIGELHIVGLLTSSAYTRSIKSIPYLRRKVDAVVARAHFTPSGHSGKALANILETYPRDELFQIDEDMLYRYALAILQLNERPRVRVLPRRDRFDRFVSVLVYVPRERSTSSVVASIGTFLAETYKGKVASFDLFFPEGPLVRIYFIISLDGHPGRDADRTALEQAVGAIVKTWNDALLEALMQSHDPLRAKQLFERYRHAFSAGYRDSYPPETAIADIRAIQTLSDDRPLAVDFHWRADGAPSGAGLKILSHGRPIPLSERVPVLENMGFRVVDERTYEIAPVELGGAGVWLHDMMLERADGGAVDLAAMKQALEACFLVVIRGVAENDGYNALVLRAGLWWRDVALIRAISRFLRQIRIAFSQDYMWATLCKHPSIAAEIVALFHARFDPRLEVSAAERAALEASIGAKIEAALGEVTSLDEDRILRHFVNAVRAALRTNFYQVDVDGKTKAQIAIKFDSHRIDDLPLPRPLYEIFVYSPRVEGVHLRFGKVARGGIRWSDRPQDFRTEILGLVKAQQVKNAVIVPVGAKGGFVPKWLPAGGSRDAIQAEGIAAYKLFISSLLDVTDNLAADGTIIPPANVVRHDDDDPYLVVAADKGTATFSDTANAISLSRDFWLGDAFASGGSAGYDHKQMGITARGAWEAVRRHFREMDVDISRTSFTVAGVGDMSGDVFGNGMLRERTIRLVAAFDHRDIFIDPNPNPEKSFAERARLFALPRSSWQDYDKALISTGGGVFPRTAKEIPLSAEMRSLLHLDKASATPQEVMRAILLMPVDLLWFGGIGTYVRASGETDDAVGDRANDSIRVAGGDLRCKVVGEGANLGMTQRGRIEAARRGVRLNTDAIDNSAGVNTSDVEVNIKIALSLPMRSGALSIEERNKVLAAMTDDVAQLVLRNNYLQTLALSLSERRGLDELGFLQRLMQTQEARGLLDRAVEFLPDDKEIAEQRRRGQSLTRPELAVLLAYAKLSLYSDLLESRVPDDPYLGRELGRYFPVLLSERFPDALQNHRLRREIIATQLSNSIINRGGPSLVVRLTDETGASAEAVAVAFAAVRDSYGMTAINGEIDQLDNKVSGKLQLDLYAAVQDLLLDRLVWFLRNVDLTKGLAEIVEHYGSGMAAVASALGTALPPEGRTAFAARVEELSQAGVPETLAAKIAAFPVLITAPDIVMVADRTAKPVATVAETYFVARDYFRLDPIANAARQIVVSDYFDRLALDRARDGLGEAVRRLTAEMVASGRAGPDAVESWVDARRGEVERIRGAIHEIAETGLTLSKLSVAASLLGDLAKG
jgi:glutamate dehydrogenase